jgi:hypothetical protein
MNLPGYDNWLEAPYQKAADMDDRFEKWFDYWESELHEMYMNKFPRRVDGYGNYDEREFQDWCWGKFERREMGL